MEVEINQIRAWLGTGSINLFGLPYSGKDTVGVRLAESINGRFLSSGMILREAREQYPDIKRTLDAGLLAPSDLFYEIVLPYFDREDLRDYPLVLSTIGRWSGEEYPVMNAAANAGHPIKAVILLNISEADIRTRWEEARVIQDRGTRDDDKDSKILDTRINEFRINTMPVIHTYRDLGLLVTVNADQSKDAVFTEVIQKLDAFAAAN